MKYSGPLYGYVAGKYLPLSAHSDDVDKIEKAAGVMLGALKIVDAAYLAQPERIRTENVCLIGKMDSIEDAIAQGEAALHG